MNLVLTSENMIATVTYDNVKYAYGRINGIPTLCDYTTGQPINNASVVFEVLSEGTYDYA